MIRRRIRPLHVVAALGFVGVTLGSIALNLAAARDLQRADSAVVEASETLTALTNLNRQALLLVDQAHHVQTAEDVAELETTRALLERHVRVVEATLHPEHSERDLLDAVRSELARADAQIAALRQARSREDVRAAAASAAHYLKEVELATKRLYDGSESIYLSSLRSTLDATRESRRALAVTGVLTAVLGAVLLVSMRRAADSDVRIAYAQLMRETKERAIAEEALHRAERRFVQNVLHASETERTRLAMALHDGPIQALTAVGYSIDVELMKASDAQRAWLEETRDRLTEEIAGLRRIMGELRPPGLDEGGLIGALRDYIGAFARDTGIAAELKGDVDEVRLDERIETVAYRIVQEALQNVRKHANASRVTVVVRLSAKEFSVTVVDDGAGFAPAATKVTSDHFGLATMSERATTVGGVLEVDSQPGRGTRVSAVLPVNVMAGAA